MDVDDLPEVDATVDDLLGLDLSAFCDRTGLGPQDAVALRSAILSRNQKDQG